MELDLHHFARVKARHQHGGGMGYLLARVRRELEQRWGEEVGDGDGADGGGRGHGGGGGDGGRSDGGGGGASGGNSPQVLLLDFPDSDFTLADTTLHRVSILGGGATAGDFCASHTGLDGVVMCLQPAWLDFAGLVESAGRALRHGGRLLFATLGPDTLSELDLAWRGVDDSPHVHPFIDMHHIGDHLLRAGLQAPIVDVDRLRVRYKAAADLHADLRAAGFINLAPDRRKTLTGKARAAAYHAAIDDPLMVTFEIIYGTAIFPPPASSAVRVAAPVMS